MSAPEPLPEIADHYNTISESARLASGVGLLEEARTRLLIERFLPSAPAVVLDIGGGPGRYAHWLAGLGYTVHLRDIVTKHIAEALEPRGHALASAVVADARQLDFDDASADAVLLLGPLYHLTAASERMEALSEAHRVLRPGGVLFAAAISRFASVLDGLWRNFVTDPVFRDMVERALADGQHRNPTGNPSYFTTAFFHHPDELQPEVAAAGFAGTQVLPVEGIGGTLPDFAERWTDEAKRSILLDLIARTEAEPSLLGVSQHLLAVGWKRPGPSPPSPGSVAS